MSWPSWKDYEEEVAEILRRRVGNDAVVERDVKLPGQRSQQDRQIDILVRGTFFSVVDGIMVVDTKLYNRAADVNTVGTFIALVEDVGADIGLIVTNQGFTDAAAKTAANTRGIHVWLVPVEDLPSWEPPLEPCRVCGPEPPESDRFPGMFWLDQSALFNVVEGEDPDAEPIEAIELEVGFCEVCGAGHFVCPIGGEINGVPEIVTGTWQSCDGFCGVEYFYDESHPKEDPAFDERMVLRIER